MDLNLSEELQLVTETIRRFVNDRLIPLEREFGDGPLPPDVRATLIDQVRDLGFWAAAAPERLGGGGIGALAYGLVLEEAGKTILEGCTAATRLLGGNPPEPLLHASESLTASLVLPLVDGRLTLAFEPPRPGTTPALALTTDGENVVLNGEVSGVEEWDGAAAVLALVSAEDGLRYVVVPSDAPGLSAGPTRPAFTGTYGGRTVLHFENVRVAASSTIAGGDTLRDEWAAMEILRTSSRLLGLVERAARSARDYAKQRVTFGQPLSNRQAIQWKLVDAEMDLYAGRWMTREALWQADSGTLDLAAAETVGLYVIPACWRSIDEVLQVYGGIGFTQDMPIEAMWRHIRQQIDRLGSPRDAQQIVAAKLLEESPVH